MRKISVVIPTLNEEKLLPAMLRQFTPDLQRSHAIELVVSDGGSTDGTLAIAREQAHVLVENKEGIRQTISIGRNRGAEVVEAGRRGHGLPGRRRTCHAGA